MRIVYFTETFLPKIDGIVTVLCLLLDYLQKQGIPSMLVTAERGIKKYADTIVHGVPGVPVPFYPELHITLPGRGTLRAMRAFKPTLVHLIHPSVTGMPGIRFARKLGVPLLASFHTDVVRMARFYRLGLVAPFIKSYTRWTYNQCDYTLATSRRMQRYLEDMGIRNVGLWRRGVDPEFFGSGVRSDETRARLTDGHPERVILLFVGRTATEKRIELLRDVVMQVPNTHLAVVGDGPHLPHLREHFAGAPATFTGYLTGQPLADAYASADIFAFPSETETFGMVVPEAMAAGIPVVTTLVGGVDDVLEEGRSGFMVPIGDVDAMVDRVRLLVENPDLRQQLGAHGREAAQNLTWDAINAELLGVYEALIAGRKPEQPPLPRRAPVRKLGRQTVE